MKKFLFSGVLLCLSGFASSAFAASTSTVASTTSTQTVEETVREYFADIPVMIEIARCESKFRQFTDSGNVMRGGVGRQMVGVFQFFDRYHVGPANALGFDIETVAGNLAYARHLYNLESTAPWNSARTCWDVPALAGTTSFITATPAVTVSDDVLRQKIALLEQIIKLLQALIIAKQNNL
jgi:hypothetical protein